MSALPTPLPLWCTCPISAGVSSQRTQSSPTVYIQPFIWVVGRRGNIIRSLSPAGDSCQVMGTRSSEQVPLRL